MNEVATEQTRILIEDYINHIDDRSYIQAVFDQGTVGGVAATLEEMVRAGERGAMRDAYLFIQDALQYRAGPTAKEFRRRYPRSSLLTAIREQIFAPDYGIRHLAICLLGKRGPRSNARVLLDALPWYIAHDPLNLDDLLSEVLWLNRRMRGVAARKRLIEQLIRAPSFVTRWAAVDILWQREVEGIRTRRRREEAWVRQLIRRLAQDEYPRVRAEARWRLHQLRRRATSPRARRTDWRERRPDPDIPSFFEVHRSVSNYLWNSGRVDYAAALVEAIAQHIVANPITPGYDIDAYWSAFEATARE